MVSAFFVQQTENNKADANKCVCLIYWKGECEMITRNCFEKLKPRERNI
nr:MAG TPA: hypothetical protein [Caudoviricetes sp.]